MRNDKPLLDENPKWEEDFFQMARLAYAGRRQDIALFVQRAARRYRTTSPHLSERLMSLCREAPTQASPVRSATMASMPVDVDTKLGLLRVQDPAVPECEPILPEPLRREVDLLIKEQAMRVELAEHGLEPRRSVLMVGPPGVGKTLTAQWIAKSLDRPLLVLDLATVISSYLGRTGTNLRQVLEYAKGIQCVLLLDELDAIAKKRDDESELGELKRLVTVLLQEIDDWPSGNLLLAATNHPDLLDRAVWRRFESILEFERPSADLAREAIQRELANTERAGPWSKVLSILLMGSSFSDIRRDVHRARRQAAVSGSPTEFVLREMVSQRASALSHRDRADLAVAMVKVGISQRDASEVTGIARDTIRKKEAAEAERIQE